MKLALSLSLFLLFSCAHKKKCCHKDESKALAAPKVAFEITEGISHPESALYSHKHRAIIVSNITSGNPVETQRVSYLSMIAPDGKMIRSQWIQNLKAPKGMAVFGDDLYVSDVNEIVRINIPKGKITKTWKVKDAKFLNDVVADNAGNIYVTDMFTDTIHKISKNNLSVWIKSSGLRGPNGLFTDGKEHIILTQWGSDVDPKTFMAKNPGHILALSLTGPNDKIVENTNATGHFDGISGDSAGNLWVSDWMTGDVYTVMKNGSAEKRYNFGQGAADLSVAKELNLLLVPQMNTNKVIAVQL